MTGHNGKKGKFSILFQDYKAVDGVTLPRHITSTMDKRRVFDMKIIKVNTRARIPASLFDPAQVKVTPLPFKH
jgi:hypothetical protein